MILAKLPLSVFVWYKAVCSILLNGTANQRRCVPFSARSQS